MKIKVSKLTDKLSSLSVNKDDSLEDKMENLKMESLSLNKIYDEDLSDNEGSFKEYEKKWTHNSEKEYQDVIKYLNIFKKMEKDISKKITDKVKKDYSFMFKKIYYKAHIFLKNISFDKQHETYKYDDEDFLELLEKIHSNIILIINNRKVNITKAEMLKTIKIYKTLFLTIKNRFQPIYDSQPLQDSQT